MGIKENEVGNKNHRVHTEANRNVILARPDQGNGSLNYLKTKCDFLWADLETLIIVFCVPHT